MYSLITFWWQGISMEECQWSFIYLTPSSRTTPQKERWLWVDFFTGRTLPASIGGVLQTSKGKILFLFSKHVGFKDLDEAEVLVILVSTSNILSCFSGWAYCGKQLAQYCDMGECNGFGPLEVSVLFQWNQSLVFFYASGFLSCRLISDQNGRCSS